ncbi:hypothetical protein SDC9_143098 [bioreactor metagenome]|uniref:Uncharacterized protein n=1 Tax=bioreactor metagenome TaxID=1076179 RepID=A0A645E5W3_9ZZZZ
MLLHGQGNEGEAYHALERGVVVEQLCDILALDRLNLDSCSLGGIEALFHHQLDDTPGLLILCNPSEGGSQCSSCSAEGCIDQQLGVAGSDEVLFYGHLTHMLQYFCKL